MKPKHSAYIVALLLVLVTLAIMIDSAKATYNPNTVVKSIRSGSVSVTALETTKAITFSTAMPSANYIIIFERGGAVASVLSPSSKATSGFTLNISVGLVETINYVAIQTD